MARKILNTRQQVIAWIGVLLVTILCLILIFFFREQLKHLQGLGLLGIFLANLVSSATVFLPTPGAVTVITGGAVYSPLLVALVSSLGSVAGDMVSYILGLSGNKILIHRERQRYVILTQWMKRFGGALIFLLAFIPNPFFDAVGILSGALAYPVYKFMFWLTCGRLARNLLLAYLGARVFAHMM